MTAKNSSWVPVLLLAVAALVLGRRFLFPPDDGSWAEAGMGMPERLARLAERDPAIYCFGEDPVRLAEEAAASAQEGDRKRSWRLRLTAAESQLRRGKYAEAIDATRVLVSEVTGAALDPSRKASFLREVRAVLLGAHLRDAETRNCLANHNADSCLLPIAGGGVHSDRSGAEAARGLLEEQLAEDPDDLFARWLLNLVAMALGDYPQGVAAAYRIDPDVFASDAEVPRFYDVGSGLGLGVPDLAGGCALEDFDRDGDVDIVASGMGRDDPLRYFESGGDGSYAERSSEAGFDGLVGGLNLNHADYDNDGLADVYVLRGAWKSLTGGLPNSLLKNAGGGAFVEVTEAAGLLSISATQTAAWADFDKDGDLDLFVGAESREARPAASELFVNQGDGTFVDRMEGSGLRAHAFVKGSTAGDYDDDGWPDLYVSARYEPNRLFRNRSAEGQLRFEEVTEAAGLLEDFDGFACWFFDYDNDGDQDLFAAGFVGSFLDGEQVGLGDIPAARLGLPTERDGFPRLYRNEGDGTFTERAEEAGLRRVILVMGANYGDLDGDGWLDMYLGTGKPDLRALMGNRAFLNGRDGRFLDVSTAAGLGHLQKGHGVAFGDMDGDGDQDLYTVLGGTYPCDGFPNALYENPGSGNDWLTLELEGVASNRAAIGARIAVTVSLEGGTQTYTRVVGTGGSFGSSTLAQEIGLGRAEAVNEVHVRWPSGAEQRFSSVAKNARYHLREGGELTPEDVPRFTLRPQAHEHGGH